MPYTHLTRSDRAVIYRMQFLGHGQAEIARALGTHRSTIRRELKRNASSAGAYDPSTAETKARARRRARVCSPKTGCRCLMRYVEDRLRQRWSPEQISGWLRVVKASGDASMQISTAHIYRWLWRDAERVEHLRPHLRHAWRKRRKPYGKPSGRGQIKNRVSIDERPAVVDRRCRLGDWEGDTMEGTRHRGYVLTLVERASRYTVARRLPDKQADTVRVAWTAGVRRIPRNLRRTATVDNGKEFAAHEAIASGTGMRIYFAHPYSAWERGTSENTNGLLRQYFPKGTDFRKVTQKELARAVRALNNRPRKCLGYRTPREVFADPVLHLG